MDIQHLKIEGSPEEMGRQHGEALKEKIQFILRERSRILLNEIPGLTIERLRQASKSSYDYFKRTCPLLEREISATAIAAEVEPHQLIQAGGYTDLLDVLRQEGEGSRFHECTLILNTEHGYLAGTWDSHESAQESLVILERRPSYSKVRTLALTTAGWPAQQGVNSAGLAFAITNLTPSKAAQGALNYICANAMLSACGSIDSFKDFCNDISFCSGHSYMILNDNSQGCIVETSSDSSRFRDIDGTLTMANHYCLRPLLDDNISYRFLAGSMERRLELSNMGKEITSSKAFAKIMESSKFVNRIDPNSVSMTCAHFYLEPSERKIYYRKGPFNGEPLSCVTLN